MKKLLAIILLAVFLPASAMSVSGVTGLNGVNVNKALVIADPRDRTITVCLPYQNEDEFPYVCVTTGAQNFVNSLTPCGIANVEEHGPEVLCGENWKKWEKEGLLPGQISL